VRAATGLLRPVWMLCAVIVVLAAVLAALGVATLVRYRRRR
jgi:membrane protein YdbS with pleckstrin-like domain